MRKRPNSAPPTFFVDLDLGLFFYEQLSQDGRFNVEFHDQHFPQRAVDDSEWLALTAKKGWIGVTHDKRLQREHRELIRRAAARVLIVVGHRRVREHASNFLVTYPKIERFVRKNSGPYTAKIYHPTPKDLKKLRPTGRVEMWGDW